jgi:hypothetical protein
MVVSGSLTGHVHLAPYPTFPRCRSLTVESAPLPVQQASPSVPEAAPSARRTGLSRFAAGVGASVRRSRLIMDAPLSPGSLIAATQLMPEAVRSEPIDPDAGCRRTGPPRPDAR